ncbi:MAG TPA: hypothetical protein VLS28_04010 [Candidatus Sulfomarinibacteraceae bacterium]|nr:hypothetical protein [Candidatus Sulfomarinibacteraceae bacterium]
MEPRPQPVDPSGDELAPIVPPVEDAAPTDAAPTDAAPTEAAAPAVGGSRARWLIGGGVAVAALAALVLAATLLGARPLPEAFRYLPADSAVVVELRPELPGDQREELGAFLAHFPGFADRSILDQKIDEVLGRIVNEASGGSVDYATQVDPLLAGPLAFSISADGLGEAMSGGTTAGILLVATTDGEVTCAALGGPGSDAGAHRDVELVLVDRDMACAMHGRFMLLGDLATIKSGLDARLDGRGMDGSADLKAARAELDGDQLATVYASGASLAALLPDASARLGLDLPDMEMPAWTIIGLRAEDDALVVDGVTAPTAAAGPPGAPTAAPAAESRFAGVLPADTLGYAEAHGVGAMLAGGLAALRADPAGADAFAQVEAALALLGGADALVGWIEEAGVAVFPVADGVGAALLIRGTDPAAAAARVAQVRNLLALAATGTDITVRDTEHAGVTITTIDLGDLGDLLGALGGLDGLGSVPGLPGDLGGVGDLGLPGDVADVRLKFALTARDDLVVIALGDGVAERILDTDAVSSLATTAGYERAMALAGIRNNVQMYVALDAVIAFAEGLASGEDLETWNREIEPYAEHLASVAWSSTRSGTNHSRLVLIVK